MNIIVAYFENLTHVVGGLEKVICDFSNEFHRRGHTVTIVTFDQSEGRPYYPLVPEVQVINLRDRGYLGVSGIEKMTREIYRLFGRPSVRQWKFLWKRHHGVKAFSEIVRQFQPDIIVSYEPMTSAEIIKEGLHIPLISSIQNDPAILCPDFTEGEKKALEASDVVHVLMPSFMQSVQRFISQPNVIYIPNIIPQCANPVDLKEKKKPFRIINVARLNKKQKRQEILVDAFALLASKYPDWTLEFWGGDTSGYKKTLEEKIRKYHLEKQIFLCGVTQNVSQVYRSADIFAMPSKNEGFSLALGEAMSAGLPVVGFASCESLAGLVEDGKSGILAKDGAEELAKALDFLMKNPEKRNAMGQEAHRAMQTFSAEKIWNQWEDVMQQVMKKHLLRN